jgi:hypothetical protein
MASCFGQYSPYTLEIFTEDRRLGREIYGRFDLGEFKGVFRFSAVKEGEIRRGKNPSSKDEFLLDPSDNPSEKDPMKIYRWREKETGEGVIKLFSEHEL